MLVCMPPCLSTLGAITVVPQGMLCSLCVCVCIEDCMYNAFALFDCLRVLYCLCVCVCVLACLHDQSKHVFTLNNDLHVHTVCGVTC